jgi:hypothetical protein
VPEPPIVDTALPFSVALVSVMSVAGWRTPTPQLETTMPSTQTARLSRFMAAA